jgi:hypothetical protein
LTDRAIDGVERVPVAGDFRRAGDASLVFDAEARRRKREPMQYLRRVDDGRLFAYASGGRFFHRVADGEVWAYATANSLYSARSGRELAYRVGTMYYDAERHVPLYSETFQAVPSEAVVP